jgi:chemotaxis methyl-accepting protein methylase
MDHALRADYGYLRDLVFGLSQNVLDSSRDYLFDSRLARLLRNQGLTHIGELAHQLRAQKNPTLERAVAEAMTINETSFFRRIEINRGLPARHIVRCFDHHGEEWTVKPELRRLCNFRQANLCGPRLPFSRGTDRFDVIFLRNVMLYFSQEHRRTLLANIHQLLAPDGILFLGSSEQPADPSLWIPVLSGGTCYFKRRQPS